MRSKNICKYGFCLLGVPHTFILSFTLYVKILNLSSAYILTQICTKSETLWYSNVLFFFLGNSFYNIMAMDELIWSFHWFSNRDFIDFGYSLLIIKTLGLYSIVANG